MKRVFNELISSGYFLLISLYIALFTVENLGILSLLFTNSLTKIFFAETLKILGHSLILFFKLVLNIYLEQSFSSPL